MKKRPVRLMFAVSFFLFVFSFSFQALGATFPEEGTTIKYIIPYGAGGGYDLQSRNFIPFLKKYLPWKKGEIVPINETGAGGYTGCRELFFAKPDGYTIGIIRIDTVLMPQILGQVAKFDITKYTFLGQFNNLPSFLVTSAKHPFLKSFADLKNPPRPVTRNGLASNAQEFLLYRKMGFNMKCIKGYKGTKEAQIAVLQGELDTYGGEYSIHASLIKSGDLKGLFYGGDKRLPEAPEVPSLKDLGYEEFANKITVDRTPVGPPGIPKDRAELLKEAVWKALNDPGFIKLSEKMEIPLVPENSENTKNISLDKINFWLKYESEIKAEVVKMGYAIQ